MKVCDFIDHLTKLDQNKEISVFFDGGIRGGVAGIVDDKNVIIVANWDIYRDGTHRAYDEDKILYSEEPDYG